MSSPTFAAGESCAEPSRSDTLSILFTGDVLLDRGVRKEIARVGADSILSGVKPLFMQHDAVVVNLECPLASSKHSISKQIVFRADTSMAAVLRRNGVTHVALANNHSVDQGRLGLKETYSTLQRNSISVMGLTLPNIPNIPKRPNNQSPNLPNDQSPKRPNDQSPNLPNAQSPNLPNDQSPNLPNDQSPNLLTKGNISVAVFNDNLVPIENWSHTSQTLNAPADSSLFHTDIISISVDSLCKQISSYRHAHPNTPIIAYLHWGTEFSITPTIAQRLDAARLIKAGATAIIGHHPHVVQPMTILHGAPIFFSLGNFIFDQTLPNTSQGQAVQLIFTAQGLQSYQAYPITITDCVPRLGSLGD